MTDTTTTADVDTGGGLTAESRPRPVAICDLVTYRLTESDVAVIETTDPGHAHRNRVHAGQVCAAVVVAKCGPDAANLRVILDGAGVFADFWATSRSRGTEPGQWQPIVH
ncbi:MAG TPA: hypothetical protein VFW65_31925 [Pseudonocardiaceae bacterium]|nr:hypothetical protein [Pseudonocardiaceae bacterium]